MARRFFNLASMPNWAQVETKLVSRAFSRELADRISSDLNKISRENIHKATDYLWRRCREQVNVPYPPASQPWHPPRRRTGTGRNAIKKRFGTRGTPSGWVYVGTGPGDYMADLEVGDVPNVLPRVWLGSTYMMYENRIANILTSGSPKGG